MAILPIIQDNIIYDDESVFEEDGKIKKRHNLKFLITITIYCEERVEASLQEDEEGALR
jgi:hypothetical protein